MRPGATLFLFPVMAVEGGLPGVASVSRLFPMLADCTIRIWRPGDSLHDATSACGVFARQHHVAIHQCAGQFQYATIATDPSLLPLLFSRIVGVQALATAAIGIRPVLQQTSTACDCFDSIGAGRFAVRRGHGPLANPKIKLP